MRGCAGCRWRPTWIWVETLKPWAAQLWVVLSPGGAASVTHGEAVTARDAPGAAFVAALQKQEA